MDKLFLKLKTNFKSIIGIILLIVIGILSFKVISPKVSSTEFHSKAIQTLDEKKMTVMELTAATATASAAVAMIPRRFDYTTC